MKFVAMGYNTVRQCFRDKIIYTAAVFSAAIIIFSIFLSSLALGDPGKVVNDTGLTAIEIMGIFLALYLAVTVFSGDITSNSILTVISRPVNRGVILLGKLGGIMVVVAINISLLTIVLILINIYHSSMLPVACFTAIFTIFMQTFVLVTVTMLFCMFIPAYLAGLCSIIFYLIGHFSEDFLLLSEMKKFFLEKFAYKSLSIIIPNFQFFNLKNQAVYGNGVDHEYIMTLIMYTFLYSAICIIFSEIIFKRKEF